MRNEQMRMAVRIGVDSIREMRRRLYPMIDGKLLGAAWMTLKAHAEYLEERGEIKIGWGVFGPKLFPA
jgi:hypothetical protein